jgi:peroxiredoxin
MRLPTLSVAGLTLIKRLAMVFDDGAITKVWYPVFPPDRNAADVMAWLRSAP